VVTVYLRHGSTGQEVPAELRPLEEGDLADIEAHWRPLLRDSGEENAHWDWRRKEEVLGVRPGYERYVLVCEGQVQGAAVFNVTDYGSREDPTTGVVYVEFVATAPWNRPRLQDPPSYQGVGTGLLVLAVHRSAELGYQGRIGLVSLPRAESFYEQRIGMTRYGPDPTHQNLVYFELTVEGVQRLLEKHSRRSQT